jgi:hypothetical protein
MSDFINSDISRINYNKSHNTSKSAIVKNDVFKHLLDNLHSEPAKKNDVVIHEKILSYISSKPKISSKSKTKKEKIKKKEKPKINNEPINTKIKGRSNSFSSKSKKNKSSKSSEKPSSEEEDSKIDDSDDENEFDKHLNKTEKHEEGHKKESIKLQKLEYTRKEENKDEQKRKKRKFYEIEENNNVISDENFLELLNSYGFNSKYHDKKNIKEILSHLSNENLTKSDSDKISGYISSELSREEEIHFSDKSIFQRLINDILNHEIDTIYPNLMSRFNENSVGKIFDSIPDKYMYGLLKKISEKYQKNKNKAFKTVFKLSNGKKIEIDENDFIEVFDDDFDQNEKNVLNNIFNGNYHKDNQEKIYSVIDKLKKLDSLIPGFPETLSELFLDFYSNNQKESTKKILKYMEIYQNENKFSSTDSKMLSHFITKKFFDSKKFNYEKIEETIESIISDNKVQYMYLELVSNLTEKNFLSFIPSNSDNEVKTFFKYVPFMKNEVEYNVNDYNIEENNKFNFDFLGKIHIINFKHIQNIEIELKNTDTNEITFHNILNNNIFSLKLIEGKYLIYKIIIDDNIFDLTKMKNNKLNFNVTAFTNAFYFGTLEIVVNNKNIKDITLKNHYKDFSTYMRLKEPDFFKIKNIKVNPSLYK